MMGRGRSPHAYGADTRPGRPGGKKARIRDISRICGTVRPAHLAEVGLGGFGLLEWAKMVDRKTRADRPEPVSRT